VFCNFIIATKAASMMVLWGIIFGIIGALFPVSIKTALILIIIQILAFIIVVFYLPQKRGNINA
jgi:hypothetical protein